MFFTLFIKECRQIPKSLVYYIYVVILILFISSQMSTLEQLKEPQSEQKFYGVTRSDDKKDIMERTLAQLFEESGRNNFATYPMGFYKGVQLSEGELKRVQELIMTCSGSSIEKLTSDQEEHYLKYSQNSEDAAIQAQIEYRIPIKQGIGYETFCKNMKQVCDLIGKGSSYEKTRFEAGTNVSQTYEGAMEEYQNICKIDRVTGTSARLFCDYAGIMLAILPIFLGVTRCLRDKRAQVSQVIYARKVSSLAVIGSRYLATVFMAFIPVVILAFAYQMPYQYQAQTLGVAVDNFAFLKYTFLWLLPEIMAVLAVSFCITEITENILSIFVQVFWAAASMFGAAVLQGNFGFTLIARWNSFGNTQLFQSQKADLFLNRGFYTGLSLFMILIAVVVYEKKRKEGITLYGKIFKGRK